MDNYTKHFKTEKNILVKNKKNKEDILTIERYEKPIKKIIKIFSKQGHSGCSANWEANYLSDVIKKILLFKPISPITGTEEEWEEYSKGKFQNKRDCAIFKEGKKGFPYYLDAIIWKGEEDYDTFTGKVDGISSHQSIKFPFVPKSFYIDVVKKPYNKKKDDDYYEDSDGKKYNYHIKDKKQLKEVSKYYLTNF